MKSKKLLLSGLHYPCTILRYFKWALEELGHTVWSSGPFCPTIPWRPELDYTKFVDVPNYITPNGMPCWDSYDVLSECPFKPDAIISVDAGFYLAGANTHGIPNAVILTDPHSYAPPESTRYLESLDHYDLAAIMQQCYMPLYETSASGRKVPQIWIPYAADTKRHFWNNTDFSNRQFDVMIISGQLYTNRLTALTAMAEAGLKVFQDSGILFEDASNKYNESVIAFNWSSEQDLCARFFEGLAMRNLVLTNRVPDMKLFPDLREDEHYVAFDSIDECVEKACYYSKNRDVAWKIASRGYEAWKAGDHTYQQRISSVLNILLN